MIEIPVHRFFAKDGALVMDMIRNLKMQDLYDEFVQTGKVTVVEDERQRRLIVPTRGRGLTLKRIEILRSK